MGREEKFFNMCVKLPYVEEKDDRDENSVPELIQVAELRDAGNSQDAIDYGKSLMKMYPNNDLIPFMIAYIYFQRHFPEQAIQVAIDAIPNCPRKYRLYSVAGLAEFDRDKLPELLVWWSRSVIAQCMVADFQEHDPFLYLAHTAEMLRLKNEAQVFFTMADAIEPSGLRLDEPTQAKLTTLKKSWAQKPFYQVIKHIDKTFLRS